MRPSPARCCARKSMLFLADAQGLRPLEKTIFSSDAHALVCRERSSEVALIISNRRSRVGESWDC
jgi:hypothetical protein